MPWVARAPTTETWTPAGTAVVVPPDPTVTAPTITTPPSIAGATTVGSTLTATPGVYTGSPTVTRVWRVNDVATSETGLTFVGVLGVVTLVETATNAGGVVTSTSNAITVVPIPPPVNTILPGITGDAVVGAPLAASAGVYTGDPVVTRVWLVDGVATASTDLTFTAVAGAIRVRETATNSGGTITALSNTITVVAIPPEPDFSESMDFSDDRNSMFAGAI